LGVPWSIASVFLLLPVAIRDWGYGFVARRRYRWFGKRDTCAIPTPDQRARFLD
jgi:predicted DCC family thiol-disulfide oxidoreductase YuxK